jgi:hypothetical protein
MPGGVITTGSHPKALWPGVHAFWGQTYAEHAKEYPDLFTEDSSGQAYEEDVQITGFGLAEVKPEGESLAYDSETQGPTQRYTHIAYALGWKVTKEERDDNLYEQIAMRRSAANAFSINQTVENLAAAVYNDAFTGNVFTFADGSKLIDTAHVNTTGGTYSNALSPGADVSEAAFEDIVIQSMGFQTDRGLLINMLPTSLHVARQQWFNANRILKSVLTPDSNNNALNVLKATNAFPGGIKMNHYFINPNAWFIRTNCPNGMTMYWRNKPEFDQDNDFDTKNAKAATYFRVSFGATDPRSIMGSNGP